MKKIYLTSRITHAAMVLMFVLFIGQANKSIGQSIQFKQLNLNYFGGVINNSDWGAADLTFIGAANVRYFNLTVDTAWVLRNIPVLSVGTIGQPQTQSFWFDIGDSGVARTNINYGFSLTPGTVPVKPPAVNVAPVGHESVIIYSGSPGGAPGGYSYQHANNIIMADVIDHAEEENFPNAEAGKNQCNGAAYANAIRYLNQRFNLGIDTSKITPPILHTGIGAGPGGVDFAASWGNKDHYCKANKLPIQTSSISGNRIRAIINEIKKGQAVELNIKDANNPGNGHMMNVVGIAETTDDMFSLTISHDRAQDAAGGLATENATYDKENQKWDGALKYASGDRDNFHFVVECPTEKFLRNKKKLLGGNKHISNPGRGPGFNNDAMQVDNLTISAYTSTTDPPALGSSATVTVAATAAFSMSVDTGHSFTSFTAPVTMVVSFYHELDSAGVEYYDTEVLSMSISGGTLPPGVMLRESPVDPSTGLTAIKPVSGGYEVYSHFRVLTELSLNGGGNWMPDINQGVLLYAEGDETSSIPTLNQWGLIAVASLLLLLGVFYIRKIV